jgi:transcriptional regulator with XRE-family HTH domain
MDTDLSAMTKGLDQALADSGLRQATFAAALGTSASRFSTYRSGKTVPSAVFYLRAVRIGAALKEAAANGWMTPPRSAAAIANALTEPDEIWAFKLTLQARDHLRELLSEHRDLAGAWEAVPATTGRPEWDTFFAALAEHEFVDAELEPPAWTRQSALDTAWVLDSPMLDEAGVRAHTPAWLAKRNIYVSRRDLTTL